MIYAAIYKKYASIARELYLCINQITEPFINKNIQID